MKFAFASCNHPVVHPSQPAWLELAEHAPDVLLLLGDNTYLENRWWELYFFKPVHKFNDDGFAHFLHGQYALQWAVPEFHDTLVRLRARQTEILGTIDDHDFLGNDLPVTPELANKAKIARLLHRQFIATCNACLDVAYPPLPDWKNAADPGMDTGLGLAQSRRYGDIQVVVLDNRSFREEPGAGHRALGEPQLRWLQTQLNSDQRLSLVFSGSPMSRGTKCCVAGSTLSQYPDEYRELLALYKAYASRNIIHVGGDLHYNDYKAHGSDRHHVEVCSSGMGTGFLPFSSRQYGNYGIIERQGHQVLIRTYGADDERNYRHDLELPG